MSNLLKFVLQTLKPFFGDLHVEDDREQQKVTIRQKEQITILTYEQVIDEIVRMFGNGN